MTRKKKNTIIGILVLIGPLIYLFLFGKLFPYSPIIIGFDKHELTNTIIYSQRGVSFDDYEKIDTLIPSIEKFHDLEFDKAKNFFILR